MSRDKPAARDRIELIREYLVLRGRKDKRYETHG